MTRAALLVVTLAIATTPAFAAPKSGEARVQFDKGVAAYTKGDYAAAAEALGASFVLEADPETLFAWAQTERKLGHCDRAIDLYTKLLGMNLPAENKQAIRVQINECKAIIAEQKPTKSGKAEPAKTAKIEPAKTTKTELAKAEPAKTEPAKTAKIEPTKTEPAKTEPVTTEPVKTEPVAPMVGDASPPLEPAAIEQPQDEGHRDAEGRAWWKDPVGGALVGAGAVGIGLGIVFLAQGSAADSDKANATTYPEYESLANRAESRGRLGVISLVAGGALATAGVVWYVTRKPASERTVTTLVLPSGGGVAFSGRF